jgi:DNA/RNA endonuclease G (NUC1)
MIKKLILLAFVLITTTVFSQTVKITGVIYDNKHKQYLGKSRIKIPTEYYKILVLSNGTTYACSNVNRLISKISVESIVQIAKDNGNNLDIEITK